MLCSMVWLYVAPHRTRVGELTRGIGQTAVGIRDAHDHDRADCEGYARL